MREVDWRLKSILDRKNQHMEYIAAVHDKNIKKQRHNKETVKISEEQEKNIMKAFEHRRKVLTEKSVK